MYGGPARICLCKVQSVDGCALEGGVGFRQLRTCRRIRPGSYVPRCGLMHQQLPVLFDHLIGAGEQ